MFHSQPIIGELINNHVNLANQLIKQKEELCYQHSKNMDAFADCMLIKEKRFKKLQMKSEIFIKFCELKFEYCLQEKEEQACIKRINNLFDDFNYHMKYENVQKL
ncbi:unnamed protein product (macronuclear) [Paramecium tetraurelia]|uniref:Uncharacterized protein n=1 Tax=Paramecium tetraurelia TaxID=5888 RepID=A0C435_PARTE|nr:uncharacterized protein GSPATT00035032001 [Paramecium tetraurelia]CAK65552.1 unnamed protein product [Paramecium tetraurelia]|eukprot:XP_001432949.1 hypothetical protein (macronuclear) [Paramecium tetraurelia strain d4-2]